MRGAQPALEVDGVFVMDGDSTIRACDFLSLEPKAELRAPIIDALLVQMQGTTTDVLVMSTLFAGKLFSHNGLRAVFNMCGTRKEDPKPWWVHAAADPSVLSTSPWLFDRPSPWRYMLIPVATNDEGVVRGGGSPGDHWVFVVVELVSCRIAYCDSCLSVRSHKNLLLHTVPFTQAAPILGPHTQLTPPPKTHARLHCTAVGHERKVRWLAAERCARLPGRGVPPVRRPPLRGHRVPGDLAGTT